MEAHRDVCVKNYRCISQRQSHLEGTFIFTISFIALTLEATITVTVEKLLSWTHRDGGDDLVDCWLKWRLQCCSWCLCVCVFWQNRANFISICLVIFTLSTGCHRITLTCWSVCFCAQACECKAIHCWYWQCCLCSASQCIDYSKGLFSFPIGHVR